jgi:hypothetical protein
MNQNSSKKDPALRVAVTGGGNKYSDFLFKYHF